MNNAISPSPEFAGLEFSLTTRKMQPKATPRPIPVRPSITATDPQSRGLKP